MHVTIASISRAKSHLSLSRTTEPERHPEDTTKALLTLTRISSSETCQPDQWKQARPTSQLSWPFRLAPAKNTKDRIWSIFLHHIKRVDHAEIGCRVLATESQDRPLAARMQGQEVGNIQDTSIQDHPHITILVVFRNLFHGVTSFGGIISFNACAMEGICQSLAG